MDKRSRTKHKNNSGFTIVELLIVIVIIAILAGIVFISYKGITNKAKEVALTSDMSNAKKALAMHYAEHGRYPETIDCELEEDFSNLCIPFGPDNDIDFERDIEWGDLDDWEDQMPGPPPVGSPVPEPEPEPYGECYTIYGAVRSSEVASFKTTCVTPVAKFEGWRQISTGGNHVCGIYHNGKAYCWGDNMYGQLGNGYDGANADEANPVAVVSGDIGNQTLKTITAGYDYTCAIASNDKAYCWGKGTVGQLGDRSISNKNKPSEVYLASAVKNQGIKSISAGYRHTCAIASDNKAYCWGHGLSGQIGCGFSVHVNATPVKVLPGEMADSQTIKSIKVGNDHTCAIASDARAYCWGNNSYGQLGIGNIKYDEKNQSHQSLPVKVLPGEMADSQAIKSISAGYESTCAIASDNKAYCWGSGARGAIGNDNRQYNTNIPVKVLPGEMADSQAIKSISSGQKHTCVIASDNKAYCWGYGEKGQMGNGENILANLLPVKVLPGSMDSGQYMKSLSANGNTSCAIASNDKAYCWGDGKKGQIGNGLKLEINNLAKLVKNP